MGFIFERKRARQVFRLKTQLQCCALELGKNTTLLTPEANSIVLRQAIFEIGGSSSEPIRALRSGHLFFALMLDASCPNLDRATLRSMPKNEKYRLLDMPLFLIVRPNFFALLYQKRYILSK